LAFVTSGFKREGKRMLSAENKFTIFVFKLDYNDKVMKQTAKLNPYELVQ